MQQIVHHHQVVFIPVTQTGSILKNQPMLIINFLKKHIIIPIGAEKPFEKNLASIHNKNSLEWNYVSKLAEWEVPVFVLPQKHQLNSDIWTKIPL